MALVDTLCAAVYIYIFGKNLFSKLLLKALTKLIFGFALIAALLFIPAGTLRYPHAWLFIGVLLVPMLLLGIVLIIKNPALLAKRLDAKEKQSEQKGVVALSGFMFLAGFIAAGLDFRFRLLPLPEWIPIAAAAVFLLSYLLYAEVMRENTYLSRTVEVQQGQKVIDTGLYGIVRHPMYSATILMFLSIPLILGSLIAFAIFLLYPIIIAIRIGGEERLLEKELDGYSEYKKRVKYRIIPFIW